ncbi:MAG: hypothetical protein PVH00_15475 [Gemmatimonadota bacterium]|jgi:hypothetical protein
MTANRERMLGLALIVLTTIAMPGCDKFLDVTNPNNLESENIDPDSDARLLGQSVYQKFVSDWGDTGESFPVYIAWYTGSAYVGDTYPTRNDFGRRDIPWNNGHINTFWSDIHENISFARTTIRSIEEAGPTLDLAKSWFVSGLMILVQAECYCEGTIYDSDNGEPRGPMPTVELLDSAIVNLQNVITVAQGVTGDDAADAADIAMAARVGIARAHLQAGRLSEAAAMAGQVPESFAFYLWHLDDSSNRSLGNSVWGFSEARISLVVPPVFRAMADAGDPRIAYVDMERVAQDGVLNFYRQDKYKGWGSSERFASGLEARYIKVEAEQNPGAMLAFINERRAAGNQAPMATTTDMGALMTELMEQKTRDFWLEGRRMADFRRVPQYMSYVIPAGDDTYYKPELGIVKGETCWPVPRNEYDNNPKFISPGG